MMEILRAKVFKYIAESAHFYYEDEEPAPKPESDADNSEKADSAEGHQ